MVAAFMSLERHEGGIQAVCAATATLESPYHQSPQHAETHEYHRSRPGAALMIN
jgi:hypothetical protein